MAKRQNKKRLSQPSQKKGTKSLQKNSLKEPGLAYWKKKAKILGKQCEDLGYEVQVDAAMEVSLKEALKELKGDKDRQ